MHAFEPTHLRDTIEALIRECVAAGEAPPFSDQTLVDLFAGRGIAIGDARGVAIVHNAELEVVVRPEHRGRGIGTELTRRALDPTQVPDTPTLAWAHGDHPAARAIAEQLEWTPVRTLLQLRAPIPEQPDAAEQQAASDERVPERPRGAGPAGPAMPAAPRGYTMTAFRPGDHTDESAWLALNAAAFATHPEQGSMSLADLRARESDRWFSGDDLLLLWDASGSLAGSCWLKVDDGIGEFYAVAVRPDLQGHGLGGALMRAGFARLAGRGLHAAALYVEGDNVPALALYRRSGFTRFTVDVQYAAPDRRTARP